MQAVLGTHGSWMQLLPFAANLADFPEQLSEIVSSLPDPCASPPRLLATVLPFVLLLGMSQAKAKHDTLRRALRRDAAAELAAATIASQPAAQNEPGAQHESAAVAGESAAAAGESAAAAVAADAGTADPERAHKRARLTVRASLIVSLTRKLARGLTLNMLVLAGSCLQSMMRATLQ